ncbi:MAG: hypothetical protein EOQ64_15520 [Mesorhizobium sp.]|uniref:hypothetical protein n=1 Tax=unclassified Mesorhizobium TaxID=325217 RepID=UPI000FD6D6BC|nr:MULTISPECIES: hypothetical protein [unclassified Mesorhizobium]TGV90059.1 hypothetical protein EN801_020615 [Mesorhizobium sp. M00.F.Ca.ET.158.01.1.1]MDG4887619.1 hypothetical protein [Mesorhizobium sp. WSM4887]RWG55872.1 MAG: hypothetical protein EOQ64_15520 [Mesorhizobium sp.]RWH44937.1 MAG: hypothetical protein EOQ78_08375 [Mesorhizobium sp.]TGQ19152.1 hypothetical protein EN860_022190 [Mesorhizobium sp. M00.F.Ca.ET.217.01.1.1]
MRRASYTEIAVTPGMVFIADRCRPGLPSVTNDAERVVEECLAAYGERRIVYRDSAGEWGELLHTGIQFRGFAPYTDRTPDEEAA